MKVYNYTVIFEPVKEGGYNVIVLKLPILKSKQVLEALISTKLEEAINSNLKELGYGR